ncbi:TetR/AcrR family transcriptional regulator [Demequina sediminicola]|uniref:TetR/AcrR family transcriptional regulator n=1 Tax=Demequina sediminicola TaxID=1095026 RepID=UPI0007861D93|nr:TetR/AcrR family transcriptional regulator [Demequina sediminicola]
MAADTASTPRGSARERLLDAAGELFYAQGINTTGVDAVATKAGVTKATLYNNFRSKDQLVAEYLRGKLRGSRERLAANDDPSATDGARVAAIFDALLGDIEAERFHGCPFAKAAIEVPGNAEAMEVVREHSADLVAHLTGITGDEPVAETIAMLYDGATIAAKAAGTSVPVKRARASAVALATV